MLSVKSDHTIGKKEVEYGNRPEVISSCNSYSTTICNSTRNSSLSIAQQQKKECHYTPKDSDIIIGMASSTRNHIGNIDFKNLIESKLNDFALFPSRGWEKSKMITITIAEVKANGANFIKQDAEKNVWSVVDEAEERKKVSHAFGNAVYRSYRSGVSSSLAKSKIKEKPRNVRKEMRTANTTHKISNKSKLLNNNTDIPTTIDVPILKKKQLEAKIALKNKNIDFHLQSILKMQQQSLDLSTRSTSNKNNNPSKCIVDEQSYLFPSSSVNDCYDRNDDCGNKSYQALLKVCAKKAYEENIVKRRIEELWKSLPKF